MKRNRKSPGKYEASLRSLASRLGRDRGLVTRRMAAEGAPPKTRKGFLVSAAKVWLDQDDPQFAALRAERWRIENQRKAIKLGVESHEYVPRSEVIAAVKALVENLRHTMRRVFVHELPVKLQGLDAVAASEKLQEACDQLCGMIHSRQTLWTKPEDPPA